MTTQTPFTPIIGLDFIETSGQRITVFQLCRNRSKDGRLEAVANVRLAGDSIESLAIDSLKSRLPAIERLARIYQQRSTPWTAR